MLARPLAVSAAGLRFITAWEGFVDHPYDDSERNATVGVGHLLHYGPVTDGDRAHWGTISLKRALQLLAWDLDRDALAALRDSLHPKLPGGLAVYQVDALCSLGLNCGPWSLRGGGSVMEAVNGKPRLRWPRNVPALAAWRRRVDDAIMLWAHPSELERRRRSEAVLFATGRYTRAQGNQYANA